MTTSIRQASEIASDPQFARRGLRTLHVIASVSVVRGGTSTAIWNTLEALRRQGIESDLVTTDDDGPGVRVPVEQDRFVERQGFRVRYFPRQTNFYSASAPMISWLYQHVRDYDLVHVHGLFSFAPITAAVIARARGVNYIVCPHGMLERWGRDNRRPWLKRSSIRFVEGPILRYASRVHFTSNSELRQAQELNVPMSAFVVPLGFRQEDDQVQSIDVQRDPATILFLSRIDIKKGIDVLLDAFASIVSMHVDARLILAGDGPEDLIRELKVQAQQLGVAHRVEWPGFVKGAAKRELLARATLFALASRSENFGFAVVEAMAAGLPVVVSRAVGISDMVERVGAGLVAETTSESIAEAFRRALADPIGRSRMGLAGRDAVRNELSLDAFGSRIAAVYDSASASLCTNV